MGCVVPRGPHKHPLAGPCGASYRRGVTKDARPHLRKGQNDFRSLADYIAPIDSGRQDYLGAFVVTAGHGVVCAPLVVFGQQKNAELLVALVGGHAHGNLIGDLFDDFRGNF